MIAGDIDIANTRKLVEKWFSDVPRGQARAAADARRPPVLDGVKKQDDHRSRAAAAPVPGVAHAGAAQARRRRDGHRRRTCCRAARTRASIERLVYDLQIAQDVNAVQQSQALGSNFMIIATARPGQSLDKIQAVIDEELDKLRATPPEPREMTRALNQIEANFYRSMERVGGFGGKANQLNSYYKAAGTPDYFQKDLERYRAVTAADIKAAVEKYLPKDRRVELSVVPGEKK